MERRGNVVLYIAASLDGYIADQDGGVGWLEPYEEHDYGYDAFYATVGTVILGRMTYEQIPTFGTPWPYAGRKTVVFTHRPLPLLDPDVELYSGDPASLLDRVKSVSDGNIWLIGGASLITVFVNAGLLDEIRLFVIPTLVRRGIPLFRDISRAPVLELLESTAYPNGVAQLHYLIHR